ARERATAELEKLGETAEAPLRQALEGNPEPEVRRRGELGLGKLAPAPAPPATGRAGGAGGGRANPGGREGVGRPRRWGSTGPARARGGRRRRRGGRGGGGGAARGGGAGGPRCPAVTRTPSADGDLAAAAAVLLGDPLGPAAAERLAAEAPRAFARLAVEDLV